MSGMWFEATEVVDSVVDVGSIEAAGSPSDVVRRVEDGGDDDARDRAKEGEGTWTREQGVCCEALCRDEGNKLMCGGHTSRSNTRS